MISRQHGNLCQIAGDRYIANTLRYVLNELRYATGTLLVAGAGDGTFERLLRQRNRSLSITSLDIDESFRADLEKVSDTVVIGDLLTVRLGRTFDYIVAIDVLEHILDTDSFFENVRRHLVPGGTCFIQTPNLASWHGRLALLMGYQPEPMEVSMRKNWFGKPPFLGGDNAIHHVRVFTYRALRQMCGHYGFRIVKAVGIDHHVPYLFQPFPGIAAQVCITLTA